MENAGSLLVLLAFGVLFYVMVLRPQQKRQAQQSSLLSSLEVGDAVVTIGGLHGEVAELGDSWVDLLVNDDVVLRYQRTAIGNIVDADEVADDLLSDED